MVRTLDLKKLDAAIGHVTNRFQNLRVAEGLSRIGVPMYARLVDGQWECVFRFCRYDLAETSRDIYQALDYALRDLCKSNEYRTLRWEEE